MSGNIPAIISELTVSDTLVNYFKKGPTVYVGRGDQLFIEAGVSNDASNSYCEEVTISANKIRDWLDPKEFFQVKVTNGLPLSKSLHLAICPFNMSTLDNEHPMYDEIWSCLQLLGLDSVYLFHEELQAPPSWFRPEKYDSIYAHFILTLVSDPTSNRTTAILHLLNKSDLIIFKDRLQILKHLVGCPLLIPLILLEHRTSDIHPNLVRARAEIYRIDKLIGTHKNYQKMEHHRKLGYYSRGEEVWQRPGFEEASAELTSLATECAYWERKCRMNINLLEWITMMNGLFEKMKVGGSDDEVLLGHKIAFMRTGLEISLIQCGYLAHRAEVQVQACASIMSQRDNMTNMGISKSSEATSLMAIRDSTDMRAIAFVTLAFLPGTFCATLFSTGFFNFDTGGRLVSTWFWLYWVVSIGLTTVVFGGWIMWSNFVAGTDKLKHTILKKETATV